MLMYVEKKPKEKGEKGGLICFFLTFQDSPLKNKQRRQPIKKIKITV